MISKLSRLSDTHAQFLRFSIVGGLVALIYFSLFILLAPILQAFLANSIAYVLAVTFQYFAQSTWTFRRRARDAAQAVRFGLTMVAAYLFATVITTWIGPALDWPNYVVAGVVVVILPVTNFIMFKIFVFRKR